MFYNLGTVMCAFGQKYTSHDVQIKQPNYVTLFQKEIGMLALKEIGMFNASMHAWMGIFHKSTVLLEQGWQ